VVIVGVCGSWIWDGILLVYVFVVDFGGVVVSMVGVGDVYLVGVVVGLVVGLDFLGVNVFVVFVLVLKVCSLYMINFDIDL